MISYFLLLQYLLFMDLGGLPAIDYATQHCLTMKSGSLLPTCNRVCSLPGFMHDEIENIKKYFDNLNFTWFVEQEDMESIKLLEEQGLRFRITLPAMSMELDALGSAPYDPAIAIEEVHDLCAQEIWFSLITEVYHYDKDELKKAINYLMNRATNQNMKLYIGFYDGEAATAGFCLYHKNVATIHMIATLSKHRGKGLGSALTLFLLQQAKIDGCTQAALLTSAMGKHMYEFMGFKEYAIYNAYGNYH